MDGLSIVNGDTLCTDRCMAMQGNQHRNTHLLIVLPVPEVQHAQQVCATLHNNSLCRCKVGVSTVQLMQDSKNLLIQVLCKFIKGTGMLTNLSTSKQWVSPMCLHSLCSWLRTLS